MIAHNSDPTPDPDDASSEKSAKEKFLRAYAKSKDVATAAKSSKVKKSRHYQWIREDPSYRKLFKQLESMGNGVDPPAEIANHPNLVENQPERDPTKLLGDPGHARADARMIARAIKHEWDIPERAYKVIPEEMTRLVEESTSEKTKVSAAKAVATMNGQNKPREPSELNVNVNVTTDQRRAQAIGIGRALLDQPEPTNN